VPVKLILSVLFAGLAVLFVIQNVTVIEVRFLVWGLHMTLSLLIFMLFAGGTMVGWLLHSYWSYKRRSLERQPSFDLTAQPQPPYPS
jgi:uncharacterized integral membrane protein